MDPSLSVAITLGAFFIWALLIYNRLVAHRNRVGNALAQIDVLLKRRHDLIPNLVNTARGYMTHERETLEAVTSARDAAQASQAAGRKNARDPADAQAMATLAQVEGMLSSSVSRLLALAEAYPDLKAHQNMLQLSSEITATEDSLSSARQVYNEEVMHFNTALQSFPAVMFAGMLGFRPAAVLAPIDFAVERTAPAVRF